MYDLFNFNRKYENYKYKDTPKTARKFLIDHISIIIGVGFLFFFLLGNIFTDKKTVFTRQLRVDMESINEATEIPLMYDEIKDISNMPKWVIEEVKAIETGKATGEWCSEASFQNSDIVTGEDSGWHYTCRQIKRHVVTGYNTLEVLIRDENGSIIYNEETGEPEVEIIKEPIVDTIVEYRVTKLQLRLAARDMLTQPFRFILRPFPSQKIKTTLDFAHNSSVAVFTGFNTLGVLIVLLTVTFFFFYYIIDYIIIIRLFLKGTEDVVRKTATNVTSALGLKPSEGTSIYDFDIVKSEKKKQTKKEKREEEHEEIIEEKPASESSESKKKERKPLFEEDELDEEKIERDKPKRRSLFDEDENETTEDKIAYDEHVDESE